MPLPPIHLDPEAADSLQTQLRERLTQAIFVGDLAPGDGLPSSRALAERLKVSRNTVLLSYQRLIDDGLLVAAERSGYFVAADIAARPAFAAPHRDTIDARRVDWMRRLRLRPSGQRNIGKPRDWKRYRYPFIYGQPDAQLFPFPEWRECSRDAMTPGTIPRWASDYIDGDDPFFVEQIQRLLLPARGIHATSDQILITLGTQHSLYLISRLLTGPGSVVGVEEPGYVDARNIFTLSGARVVPLPVDDQGLLVGPHLDGCDVIYVTPSHQSPTTVTMSMARRDALVAHARAADILIVEDDYESELGRRAMPSPALYPMGADERVLYVSSLSKTLAPGLRLGYLVAGAGFVREARALRRLMLRHPPLNNQRTASLFIARGYHELTVQRLTRVYEQRWQIMREALVRWLPSFTRQSQPGSTSFWLAGPSTLDSERLARDAATDGVLIEPGRVHFLADHAPRHFLRLSFAATPGSSIAPGIRTLATHVASDG